MEEPPLNVPLHIKYWERCLKSILPNAYQSNDSSRMALAFFILSALEILGAGADGFSSEDILGYRKWILGCQHPSGGFCGSPTHKYPDKYYDESEKAIVDQPNLAATFFAILTLNFVGGLEDIRRTQCLRYLKRLQREDGSFGELLGENGKVEGGRDMRYCHFATTIRWALRGDLKPVSSDHYDDIDVEKLVKHILAGETYDGGIGESSEHEAHGGYTYCAIATLSTLGRLPESISREPLGSNLIQPAGKLQRGLTNLPSTVQWLMSRQLAFVSEEAEDDDDYNPGHPSTGALPHKEHHEYDIPRLAGLSLDGMPVQPESIAFNGRLNKPADTCYSWWGVSSFEILGQGKLVDRALTRRFLLKETQHRIGGFGKEPGHPPDIYHSYLGLATLALMKEPGLKEVDPVLPGISLDAKEKLLKNSQKITKSMKYFWKDGIGQFSSEDEPEHAENIAGAEGPPKYMVDLLKKVASTEKKLPGSQFVAT